MTNLSDAAIREKFGKVGVALGIDLSTGEEKEAAEKAAEDAEKQQAKAEAKAEAA